MVEQIAPDTIGRAHADQAGRELIEIGLAEHERSGLPQPGDARGILVGAIAVSRARGGGRQPVDVDIILDRDRNAVERQRFIAAACQRARLGDDVCFFAQRDEDRRVIMGADALEAARDNILGLNCSAAISVEDFGDRFGHVRLRFGATG